MARLTGRQHPLSRSIIELCVAAAPPSAADDKSSAFLHLVSVTAADARCASCGRIKNVYFQVYYLLIKCFKVGKTCVTF